MTNHTVYEGILLDESMMLTLSELCECGQVEEHLLIELMEHGIIEPKNKSMQPWMFGSHSVLRVQKAIRLHNDLAINWEGISVVLELLDEVNALRQTVAMLKKGNDY